MLTTGYEKLMLDADHLGAVHALLGGLAVDCEALALDAATDEALREYMARRKESMPDIWH